MFCATNYSTYYYYSMNFSRKTRVIMDGCFALQKIFFRNNSDSSGPLKGIRVIDLSRIIAGPYCSMLLGDLGAEVIKIEQPVVGDECRHWGPPFIGNTKEACYFMPFNRNKKSVCVDLKSPTGQDIIHKIARTSDILIENFVPGKLNKLNLGYDQIKKIAPQLIYCSITGFGSQGPYSNRPGYDVIAASMGGLLHITGPRNGEPCKTGTAMIDLATGLFAHGAIMAALLQRHKTHKGQKIDCDLLSTVVASLVNIGSNYLNAGEEASRWGTAHSSIVPYQSFASKDGYYTIGTGSNTQFVEDHTVPRVTVKLKKPKNDRKVNWTTDTVDNEHMNKKKSKCCCVYNKPRTFGESSSDSSDDECEHCQGHVEKRKHGSHNHSGDASIPNDSSGGPVTSPVQSS